MSFQPANPHPTPAKKPRLTSRSPKVNNRSDPLGPASDVVQATSMLGSPAFSFEPRGSQLAGHLARLIQACCDRHQYESAAWYADKLVTVSNNAPEHVHKLAECYYLSGQYARAVKVLEHYDLMDVDKQRSSGTAEDRGTRVSQRSLAYFYLAARCYFAMKQHDKCVVVLESCMEGRTSQAGSSPQLPANKEHAAVTDGSAISLVACMHELRGHAFLALENHSRAAEWLMTAIKCDPYCVGAVQALIDNHLLSDGEEAALGRYFDSVLPDAIPAAPGATVAKVAAPQPRTVSQRSASLTKKALSVATSTPTRSTSTAATTASSVSALWLRDLYTCRLNRYTTGMPHDKRFSRLVGDAGFESNLDVMASQAEWFEYQHQTSLANALTSKIMEIDPYNPRVAVLHYITLVSLNRATELFRLAHHAVDVAAGRALSWFAVGCYYLVLRRYSVAIKHLTKATRLDKCFAPAWIGLGHAYAGQDEVEPALAAYRTAMRLLPSAHLPPLAMATLSMKSGEFLLARQYIDLASARCPSDPLIYHEAGVLEYYQGVYPKAYGQFQNALSMIQDRPPHLKAAWEATMVNMGHTCRKLGDLSKALHWYEEARALSANKPSILAALAFTYHLSGEFDKAIECYHAALTLAPTDSFCQSMLSQAMQDVVEFGPRMPAAQLLSVGNPSDMTRDHLEPIISPDELTPISH